MRTALFALWALPLCAAAVLLGCSIEEPYVDPSLPAATVAELPPGSVVRSVFFIGDAGEPSRQRREPTFRALEREASRNPERTCVVFLGDNIYPSGLPRENDPERADAEWALMEQLRILLASRARGVFLSGNHDWDWGGDEGLEAVARQERFLQDSAAGLARLLPPSGCPGPAVIDLDSTVRLVLLDTEWWLHAHAAGPDRQSECPVPATELGVLTALADAIRDTQGRAVLVAGHHPLETYGSHGGFFPWEDHLFPLHRLEPWLWIPLPVIGSAYPVARRLGISDQDLAGARNRHMVRCLDSVLATSPPLLYAAGHEHTLQVLRGSRPFPLLVSGNGIEAHDDPLTTAPSMLFGDTDPGFMRVDIADDGRVRLGVIQPADDEGTPRESFSMWLRATATPSGDHPSPSQGRKNR
jgi:hypothetical protein